LEQVRIPIWRKFAVGIAVEVAFRQRNAAPDGWWSGGKKWMEAGTRE